MIRQVLGEKLVDAEEHEMFNGRQIEQNIYTMMNRARNKLLPPQPKLIDFTLDKIFVEGDSKISDFVVLDFFEDGVRIIILSSRKMLTLLKAAEYWFCDGTYKVVRKPFYQLWSIHVFIQSGHSMKQIPVAFVLMSHRRQKDYETVLYHLRRKVGSFNIQRVVLDFEAAAWQAFRSYMPHVTVKGCMFHFTQAIFRKVQLQGLQASYNEKSDVYRLCKSLMALPMLPELVIVEAFEALIENVYTAHIEADNRVQHLVEYVRKTWIESRLFTPRSWCWFNEGVRTNNDTEGWHNKLNTEARSSKLPTYRLISILGSQANLVTIQVGMVKLGKLRRKQTKKTIAIQKKLEQHWDEYRESADHLNLLDKVSHLVHTSGTWASPAIHDH